MKFLQKLGKALMLPVAVLPICGILMGIGYWLCPATMQGGDIHGVANLIGLFLVKAGGALIDNMAILYRICCITVCMAITFQCTCSIRKSDRRYGCCWCRYLCIPEPSADPYRITSRTEQCILV